MKSKGAPIDDSFDAENIFYWMAYSHLRRSRNTGFTMGPIPISEIMSYCNDFVGITCPVQKTRFVNMITEMDREELANGHAKTST